MILPHHSTVDELQISAHSGCHLCSLLLQEPATFVYRHISSNYLLCLFKESGEERNKFSISLGQRTSMDDLGAYY